MLDRRTAMMAAVASAVLPSIGRAQPKPGALVRYDVASTEGKAMLRVYAQGVKALQAENGQQPKSWIFQWYTHATPQSKAAEINSVFGSTKNPNRTLANEVWYTCQSHLGQPEDYFLPWHRLYVMYLEQIIRSVTSTPTFTLPYWNYTDSASYAIPEEFQAKNQNDPVFGALYRPNRNKDDGSQYANVNAGEPINKYFTGADNFLNLNDMTKPNYSGGNGFDNQLDQNLHGSVHDFVGDDSNMGNIPTAAGDPIFWLHHCNIDRIWYGWNAGGGKNPKTTGWTGKTFVFANGEGKRVSVPISLIADSAGLNYTYDKVPSAPRRAAVVAETAAPPTAAAALAVAPAQALLRSVPTAAIAPTRPGAPAAPIQLGATAQSVTLVPTAPANRLLALALPPPNASTGRLLLTLHEVRAQASPGTLYRVYVDLPPDAPPAVAEQHFAGILNFFNAVSMTGMAGHGGRTATFDITDLVQRLHVQNQINNETKVTLVPTGRLKAEAAPVIAGGIEIMRQ